MAQPPFTLGMDVCGTVEAAGAGAEHLVGRRVVAMCAQSLGGMADFALAPASGVFDAPPELDDVEAAAFLLPFHTTYLALHTRAKLLAGEHLLVVGGATSLGTAAIQLGVAAGAHVIAIAGGPEKGELCQKLGAELAIDHTSGDDIFDLVMAHTGERGADVACDMVGGAGTETIWTCMAYEGRYVPVGFNDDTESGMTGRPLRKVSTGNFSVVGVLLRTCRRRRPCGASASTRIRPSGAPTCTPPSASSSPTARSGRTSAAASDLATSPPRSRTTRTGVPAGGRWSTSPSRHDDRRRAARPGPRGDRSRGFRERRVP
jgi:NADPH:quinone reductase-like Zn-dependent oxidoreductase